MILIKKINEFELLTIRNSNFYFLCEIKNSQTKKKQVFTKKEMVKGISYGGKKININFDKKWFLVQPIVDVFVDGKKESASDSHENSIYISWVYLSMVFLVLSLVLSTTLFMNRELNNFLMAFLKTFSIGIDPFRFNAVASFFSIVCISVVSFFVRRKTKLAVLFFIALMFSDTIYFSFFVKSSNYAIYFLILRYVVLSKVLYLSLFNLFIKNQNHAYE